MKNGVFSKDILFIQRPDNVREEFHELSIFVALHLDFVYQLQLKLPTGAEGVQKFRPCFHLHCQGIQMVMVVNTSLIAGLQLTN